MTLQPPFSSPLPPPPPSDPYRDFRIQEALKAHDRGWVLTPLRGKAAYLPGWTSLPPPTRDEVYQWALQGNVGVRTGTVSGVIVIDDDTPDCSAAQRLGLPLTVTVISGSGKRHYYFLPPAYPIATTRGKLGDRIELIAEGAQVVFPGSIHPDTGGYYTWAPGLSPNQVALAPLPEHVLALLQQSAPVSGPFLPRGEQSSTRADAAAEPSVRRPLVAYVEDLLADSCAAIRDAKEGSRNDLLNKRAFILGKYAGAGLIDHEPAAAHLYEAGLAAGLAQAEAAATVRSGLTAGMQRPISRVEAASWAVDRYHPTDAGNAQRLADIHGPDVRYCDAWKKFLVWDGQRWAEDDRQILLSLARDVARSIQLAAERDADEERKSNLQRIARQCESRARLDAFVHLLKSEPGIAVTPEDLDPDIWLLNCRNGTIDLRTGELSEHDRGHLITKVVEVEYDPAATCHGFERFLAQVVPDAEVRSFLQRAVGMSLTGDVSEQCFLFLYGTGANGKSVLLRVIEELLGPYCGPLPSELLLEKKVSEHPTSIAKLRGLRMAIASELPSGGSFNEALIKQLTGGDRIAARRMREDFWDFQPQATLWISGNHRPRIKGGDYGIWRRVLLVPFEVRIPDDEQDPQLIEKLTQELPGILRWAVEGCLEWRSHGLNPPAAVQLATGDYRDGEDRLQEFLDLCTQRHEGGRAPFADLYRAYQAWCEVAGETLVHRQTLGKMLDEKGFRGRKSGSTRWRLGLALRPEVEKALTSVSLSCAIQQLVRSHEGQSNTNSGGGGGSPTSGALNSGSSLPAEGEKFGPAGNPFGSVGTPGTGGTPVPGLSPRSQTTLPHIQTKRETGVPPVPCVPGELTPPPGPRPPTEPLSATSIFPNLISPTPPAASSGAAGTPSEVEGDPGESGRG